MRIERHGTDPEKLKVKVALYLYKLLLRNERQQPKNQRPFKRFKK